MQNNHLKQFISIGELAKRSGVSVATLRFYEEKQLIWSVRTNGNQRRYLRASSGAWLLLKLHKWLGSV